MSARNLKSSYYNKIESDSIPISSSDEIAYREYNASSETSSEILHNSDYESIDEINQFINDNPEIREENDIATAILMQQAQLNSAEVQNTGSPAEHSEENVITGNNFRTPFVYNTSSIITQETNTDMQQLNFPEQDRNNNLYKECIKEITKIIESIADENYINYIICGFKTTMYFFYFRNKSLEQMFHRKYPGNDKYYETLFDEGKSIFLDLKLQVTSYIDRSMSRSALVTFFFKEIYQPCSVSDIRFIVFNITLNLIYEINKNKKDMQLNVKQKAYLDTVIKKLKNIHKNYYLLTLIINKIVTRQNISFPNLYSTNPYINSSVIIIKLFTKRLESISLPRCKLFNTGQKLTIAKIIYNAETATRKYFAQKREHDKYFKGDEVLYDECLKACIRNHTAKQKSILILFLSCFRINVNNRPLFPILY